VTKFGQYEGKRHYRLHPGYLAWMLMRASGVMLALYLPLHIWVTHHLASGEAAFNQVMAAVQNPLFHVLEAGLLGVVLFHGLNGLRCILVDYAGWARREVFHKAVVGVFAVSLVLVVIGAVPMIRLAFAH